MNDDTVVERLAARGPSGIRAPHCWFCGKVEAWFQCDCPEARDAQQGRRTKPRFDATLGAMILDEDIIERNLKWGYARRYVRAGSAERSKPQAITVDSVNTTVNTAVNETAVNTVNETPVSTAKSDRRAYHREYMRKRREQQQTPSTGQADPE